MKTNKLTISAILLAVGTVLRLFIPGIIGGVKPDFLLALMLVAIIIQDDLKGAIAIGVVSAILASLTSNFPGAQVPQTVDKITTALLFFAMIRAFNINTATERLFIKTGLLFFLATMYSGTIFLIVAMFTVGISAPLYTMIAAIVLPTAIMNIFFGNFAYKMYLTFTRRRATI